MKTALITGALGQDGSYMAEHLLSLDYEVWGTIRVNPRDVEEAVNNYVKGVHYMYADMRDEVSLETVIRKCFPDEIYNFAGQVFVPTSWERPAETLDINTSGFARLLHVVERVYPESRVYQASSSEMYGNMLGSEGIVKLDELSTMRPVSPYGVSKYAAHKLAEVYREKGMYVVSGICFNHESPRRGDEMVTRKITKCFAKGKVFGKSTLRLGNVLAKRDWGFAGDYVKAMHLMLQKDIPEDFVIGTGKAYSVNDFVYYAAQAVGNSDNIELQVNCPEFSRPNELFTLVADASRAWTVLGWKPKTSFEQLVNMMVEADIERYQRMRCAAI